MWEWFIQSHWAHFSIVGCVASFALCWWVMLQAKQICSSDNYVVYMYSSKQHWWDWWVASGICSNLPLTLGTKQFWAEEGKKMGHSEEQSKKTIPSPGVSTFQVQQGFPLSSHVWGTLGTQGTAGHFKAWPKENFSPLGKASRIWLTEQERWKCVCHPC